MVTDLFHDCRAGAAEYNRMTARQMEERNICTPVQKEDPAAEIRAAMIEANLEGIRFWTEDVGALVTVREAFTGNTRIFHLTRHLIGLETATIESLAEEINQWRTDG